MTVDRKPEHASSFPRHAEVSPCPLRTPPPAHRRERGVQLVTLLTAIMMGIEISVGYMTRSMALLADGWHMASHVGALGMASLAYAWSRRLAAHPSFVFGTGKVQALAGYTSAIVLGVVALLMGTESSARLLWPERIDFVTSLPVAVVGLFVNLASVGILHVHDDETEEEHDHNHRAAFFHVVADTLTSALAIVALLCGRWFGWTWVDSVSGLVGAVVILRWAITLCRSASVELLDLSLGVQLEDSIRDALESVGETSVRDLHVWSLGGGARGCLATLVATSGGDREAYRRALQPFGLRHLTLEIEAPPR